MKKFVTFLGYKCKIKKGAYATNGRTVLELIIAEGDEKGCPMTTATINIPEIDLAPNEVIIKDYSENDGLLEILVKENIVKKTGRDVQLNYGSVPICILCE